MADASRWDDWHNAELYATFVDGKGIYRQLNRRLAAAADLSDARRLLDVACGTGATVERCLELLPRDAEVVAVDASRAMVEVASARVVDPRVRFSVARAGRIGEAVDGPFDRLVCNAAFWQLPPSLRVLSDLATLAAPGARFAFNLPASRLAGEESAAHPFQVALARAVEARGGAVARTPVFARGQLASRLRAAGFAVEDSQRFTWSGRQGELVDLMALPAMIADVAPGLTPAEQAEAVEAAGTHVDREAPVEVDWLFVVAVREG